MAYIANHARHRDLDLRKVWCDRLNHFRRRRAASGWIYLSCQTQTDSWKYALCPVDAPTAHADVDTAFPNH
jgi:hypothetical protein